MSGMPFGIEPGIVIAACSLLFSMLTFEVNRRFGKRARLKEIQRTVQEYQNEMKEATKRKDDKKLKELAARESEMLSLTQEMMALPFRSMVIVIPLFFGALWLVPPNFPGYVLNTPFPLPVPNLGNFSLAWRSVFGPRGAFILWSVVFGMLIETIVSRLEAKARRASKG